METFEIHITGDESINKVLDALGHKNIVVSLLYPDAKTVFRTEYMSSIVKQFNALYECEDWISTLIVELRKSEVDIIRIKVECPYYEHYLKHSLYLESHFKPFNLVFPISRNEKSGKLIATDRIYAKSLYDSFRDAWKNEDVEMCVYDTFPEEDFDRFKLYNYGKV